jgi:hypothetical protein
MRMEARQGQDQSKTGLCLRQPSAQDMPQESGIRCLSSRTLIVWHSTRLLRFSRDPVTPELPSR